MTTRFDLGLVLDKAPSHLTWLFNDQVFRQLAYDRHGLVLCSDRQGVQAVLVSQQNLTEAVLDEISAPVIVYGAQDSAAMPRGKHTLFADPRVKLIWKGSRYVDRKYHRAPVGDWRLHVLDNPEGGKAPDREPPDQSLLDKIQVLWGFLGGHHLVSNYHQLSFPTTRSLDLHCVLIVPQACPYVRGHREAAVAAAARYLQTGRSAIVAAAYDGWHPMTAPAYRSGLCNAYSCLSPWGNGEYCYRDYEALLCGALLLKPDTAYAETWPPLEPGRHYIPVRTDFADVAAGEYDLRQLWAANQHRQQDASALARLMTREALVDRLWECLEPLR